MEWVMRSKKEMHKYGAVECPNYKDYPSFFTIKLYYGGHFENFNSKFVGYKIDYFDFCNIDLMSVFEIGSMVSESIGRKSVAMELYFKSPNEGMDEIGKLETDGDIIVMTSLISDKVKYIEVFTVLVEPVSVEGKRPILEDNEQNDGNGTDDEREHNVDANESNEEGAYSEADEDREWHPDSSNDGNSKQDEIHDDVSSVSRDYIEYRPEKWDDHQIEFNDEIVADSEDEKMAVSSEDKIDSIFSEFHEHVDMMNPKFQLGMLFSSADVLKRAVRSHAIIERRPVVKTPNMEYKVQYMCTPPCAWKIYANKCQKSDTYQIRTYFGKHPCQLTWHQKQVSAEWIAKRYEDDIRLNPTWECEAFQRKVVNDLGCQVNKSMIYRAKNIALKMINGTYEESFAAVWDYGNEIKRVMPDSTVAIELEDVEAGQERGRFKRIYIYLGPVKKGYIAGCRPIVGLDGCHLKGPYGGQLLTAVGMDPDDGMYPIAWSVVDAENTVNWHWFLTKLKEDLNMSNDASWTFISDKQKGLINALEELCPNAEQRFCAMHLYNNMSKVHKGLGLRGLMWSAARSTTDYHFERNMVAIQKLNLKCYEWLSSKPKEQWSRSGFRTFCKSDLFVNNHCEVFNSSIKNIRHLPIITILKNIHSAVMRRIQRRKLEAEAWYGKYSPNSLEKLNEANKKSVGCHVTWSGGPRFLVQTSAGGYELVVDMEAKTCQCRKWQLSGVPCFHAVACMNSRGLNLEDGIHACYTIAMFKKVYSHIVEPISGKEAWAKPPYIQLMPPNVKPSTGRPKMKRNRKNDTPAPPGVTNLKRMKTSLKCGNCDIWGHNRRTCKNKKNEEHGNGEREQDQRHGENEANQGEQDQRDGENQPTEIEQEQGTTMQLSSPLVHLSQQVKLMIAREVSLALHLPNKQLVHVGLLQNLGKRRR